MNLLVIGCGRVGAELAYRLYRQGHQVTVIDEVPAAFENLPPDFRGRTLTGDVMSQDVLRRAGIEQAQGVAAVTISDSVNAVVARVANEVFNVPNIVVRNYDPRERPLLEAFGLQVVSPSSWGAQRIAEMVAGLAIRTVFSAGNGEVEVYELVVPAAWHGRALGELLDHAERFPVAVTRAGRAMLPAMDLALEPGDIVHISTTEAGIAGLRSQIRALREA